MSVTRDFRLTSDFWLREFSVSAQHPELVQEVPDALMPHVIALAFGILQPIRTGTGPIRILSGYRPRELNDAVGGSDTSQHMRAEAADIVSGVIDALQLFRWVRKNTDKLQDVGQVIYYPSQNFVHIALASARYSTPTFFEKRHGVLRRV